MNIEEERKAFEMESMRQELLSEINTCAEWDGEKYKSKFSNAIPYVQTMFSVWLAAKAQADSDIQMLLRVCAFESVEHARKWDVEKECQHLTAVTAQQFFDDGFAKGVAHAAEMAKPTGRVKQSVSTGWWVYYDVYQYGGIESKEAAEKWLIDRGYRVIEE